MPVSINEELFTGGVAVDDYASLLAAVDGLEGFVDGIEGLLTTLGTTSTNILAAVDGLEGFTDGLEGFVDGIESSLNTIAGQVYTEGDVDTTITGPAILAEDTSTSTLRTVQTKQLGTQVTSSDYGLIMQSIIHGLSSAGGGSYVDVKVNPSGSLEVNANQGTHDNLNANANIQVNNTDVSTSNPVPTKDIRSATGTLSNVAASATSVTLLASNANRLGASFYNDSTVICYLKHGATASSTSFTVKMYPEDYYEIPYGYTGVVDGIWVSATGSMRVTEQT